MSVSVVIPAYKAAATIGRAVDSVLAQTVPVLEIVVVDDGSPEDLAPAVARYGDRVRLLRKPNGGAASARNLGVDEAKGDFVAFLDADDYWEPHKLAVQLEVFRRHPEVGLCSAHHFVEPPGEERTVAERFHPFFGRVLVASGREAFEVAMALWTTNAVIRRDVLGTDRFPTDMKTAEDRDLWVRLALRTPIYICDEPLATAVLEPQSLSRSNIEEDCANMLEVIRRYRDLLGPRHLRRVEAQLFRRLAGGLLRDQRPRRALVPALRRTVRDPLSPEGWWVLLKSAALTLRRAEAGRR